MYIIMYCPCSLIYFHTCTHRHLKNHFKKIQNPDSDNLINSKVNQYTTQQERDKLHLIRVKREEEKAVQDSASNTRSTETKSKRDRSLKRTEWETRQHREHSTSEKNPPVFTVLVTEQ